MPSIVDLFDVDGERRPFDPAALDEATRTMFAQRDQNANNGGGADPAGNAGDARDAQTGDGAGGHDAGQPAGEPPPPPPPAVGGVPAPPPAVGPDLEFDWVRQAMADPARAEAIRRAAFGIAEPPAPVASAPPPAAPPEPQLPEHIDPTSFEAELWRQNRQLEAQLSEFRTSIESAQAQTAETLWAQEAQAAGVEFAQRYAGRISEAEFQAIAMTAGQRGLPRALESVYGPGNTRRACLEAMEFVLRSNPALLAKVAPGVAVDAGGAGSPPPPAPPPGIGSMTPHMPAPSREDVKRTLTALSTGASPVGEAPVRPALQHRPDGRLDESSRRSVVDSLAAALRQPEG